jgi:phospholipid transport system transporter-binding protein
MMAERNAGAGPARGFVSADGGARWTYQGALTFAEAGAALAAAHALALPSGGTVDCSGIDVFDSAAVAVLVALKRRATAEGRALAFPGLPDGVAALAALYGVEEILAARSTPSKSSMSPAASATSRRSRA